MLQRQTEAGALPDASITRLNERLPHAGRSESTLFSEAWHLLEKDRAWAVCIGSSPLVNSLVETAVSPVRMLLGVPETVNAAGDLAIRKLFPFENPNQQDASIRNDKLRLQFGVGDLLESLPHGFVDLYRSVFTKENRDEACHYF
jgi:hypothetical protein